MNQNTTYTYVVWVDRQADNNAPHQKHNHPPRVYTTASPHCLLYGCKTSQSSRPSHFQLCSDQYLSVSQEETTVNHNEICSTKKILSVSHDESFLTWWRRPGTRRWQTLVSTHSDSTTITLNYGKSENEATRLITHMHQCK